MSSGRDGMRNRLLSRLAPTDLDQIRPHLDFVEIPVNAELETPDRMVESVYFFESGLASTLVSAGDYTVEVAMMGFEGACGLPVILGSCLAGHQSVMRVQGSAFRIASADLRRIMAERPAVAAVLLRYAQVQVIQVAQTSLANAGLLVQERLARWLLMAHDRVGSEDLRLTHDVLAAGLGVRRPGVTVALHELEGMHAIRSKRVLITIQSRDKLSEIAGPAYGPSEAAYETLLGAPAEASAAYAPMNGVAASPS